MDTFADIPLPVGRTALVGYAAGGPQDPVVVVLPALGVGARYYRPLLAALRDLGVAAVSFDFPGQGESRPLPGPENNYGYAALARVVVPAAMRAVAEHFPGRPVTLLGHSLGGQVGCLYLAHDHPEFVRGLILVGAGSPWWRVQERPLYRLVQTQLVGAVSRVRGYWPGDRFGFGGRQPSQLMREWSAYGRTGRITPRGWGEAGSALAQVALPVLAISLDNDDLAPASCVDHLASMLPNASVTSLHYTRGRDHPGLPVDHFSFARSPEGFAELVTEFASFSTPSP